MKKSTKKRVSNLSQYIGQIVIRNKPTVNGDWSYVDRPIQLVGFTNTGCIVYKSVYTDFGADVGTLPVSFTDNYWVLYKRIFKSKKNPLNKWQGRFVKRCRPTRFGDCSYMWESYKGYYPRLVSATANHIILNIGGENTVVGSDFADPDDWRLVE